MSPENPERFKAPESAALERFCGVLTQGAGENTNP